ncbi:MAG TPA: amidohydrolase family protein [Nitrososphaerales archaeon]|nr:amidohydrolase family protein [Nitrososphaerales archaeon]
MPRQRMIRGKTFPSLDGIEVTDIHCFAFPKKAELTRTRLAKIFSLGGPTVNSVQRAEEQSFESLTDYSLFLNYLTKFLGCKNTTKSLLDARTRRASREGFQKYVASLFNDVRLRKICLDDGLFPESLEQLGEYVPFELFRIARIENIINKLLEQSKTRSYSDLVEKFEDELKSEVRNGAVALKSIIAYRSGLDIDPEEDERRAEQEFDDLLEGKTSLSWFGPVVPKIRNALLIRAMRKAGELGIFFEIHTGLGDTDILGSKCNPILLQSLFKDSRVRGTKVVLVHCGYPYTIEASWLARDFPNVFVELSSPHPPAFSSTICKERFFEILSMAPAERIVYGSDCFELPELHWLSAKLAKKALSETFAEMISKEMISREECYSKAKQILSGNADSLIKS